MLDFGGVPSVFEWMFGDFQSFFHVTVWFIIKVMLDFWGGTPNVEGQEGTGVM